MSKTTPPVPWEGHAVLAHIDRQIEAKARDLMREGFGSDEAWRRAQLLHGDAREQVLDRLRRWQEAHPVSVLTIPYDRARSAGLLPRGGR